MARYSSKSWRNFSPHAALSGASNGKASAAAPVACRILGLDPGSVRTGYGLIDCTAGGERHLASGVIKVTGADLAQKLRCIFEAVTLLVAEHQPQEIAIERVFVHRNPDSALKLGQARGVALCAAVSLGAGAHEYAPRAIKLAVSGYGGADKAQVTDMITRLLTLPKAPAVDAADALAVALCHAYGRRLAALGAR